MVHFNVVTLVEITMRTKVKRVYNFINYEIIKCNSSLPIHFPKQMIQQLLLRPNLE
jgi:hypothetical protein